MVISYFSAVVRFLTSLFLIERVASFVFLTTQTQKKESVRGGCPTNSLFYLRVVFLMILVRRKLQITNYIVGVTSQHHW